MIVLGHSHAQCAFNDSLISNFQNFGGPGESYFYSYFKFLELIKQNKNIKTVFIEYSNNQVNESMDGNIWKDVYISKKYTTYSPFMNLNANLLLLYKNSDGFFKGLSITLKKNLNIILTKDYNYSKKAGGYIPLARDIADSSASLSTSKKVIVNSQNRIAKNNIRYLLKIIEVCKTNNIKAYLLRCPLHPMYSTDNEEILQQTIKVKLPLVEFLDFKDFPMLNSCYGDLHHLNRQGSRNFSIFFNELLVKGLMDRPNKQEHINNQMKKTQMNTLAYKPK